jgi:hypothetical protein
MNFLLAFAEFVREVYHAIPPTAVTVTAILIVIVGAYLAAGHFYERNVR